MKPGTTSRRASAATRKAKEKAARELCALRVRERGVRAELRRAEGRERTLTRQHTVALDRLHRLESCSGCPKSALCTARPAVREYARRLAATTHAREQLLHQHTELAAALVARGVKVPPLVLLADQVPRPRGPGPKRHSCGTVCHIQVEGGVCGGQAAVLLPSASGKPREIPTRYCLLEAASIITSHDPMTFEPDRRYPAATQERRYDRDRGEQMKVVQIAQNPRPELVISTSASALDGTPVVTSDRLALGGNGRTMGIRRHYQQGGEVFRRYLLSHAHEFGFTAAQVKRFDEPVVVRTIDPPREEYARYVRDLNQGLTQVMDAVAESVSLARQMPPAALEVLATGLEEQELGEFFASRASLPFIAALEKGGLVTQQNRGRMVRSDGLLTEDGRALAIRQIGAAVLPDADLLELMGAELRLALARSAPWWLAAAAHGHAWDLRVSIHHAVRDLLAARAAELTLRRFFQQVDFFNPPQTTKHPLGLRMLVLLDKLGHKPAVLGKVAQYYATEASMHSGKQKTLLAPKSPVEALDEAAAHVKIDLKKESGGLS